MKRSTTFLLFLIVIGTTHVGLGQTSWTLRNSHSGDLLYDVTFGNATFVAVGTTTASGTSVTSPDGVNWTHHVSAVGGIFYGVAYGNGRFVAVGTTTTSSISAVSTDDGATWSGGPVAIGLEFRGVAWTGNEFVAVGGTGANAVIATSPDGTNWTGGVQGFPSNLRDIVQGGTTRVAVGSTGTILYSLNGGAWDRATGTPNVDWEAVTYAAGHFLVVGAGGIIMTSTDGVSWVLGNSGVGDPMYGACSVESPAIWLGTGMNGRIIVSNDTVTWTTVLPAIVGDILYATTFGVPAGSTTGQFVAVGNNGRIISSVGPDVSGGLVAQFEDDPISIPSTGGNFTAHISAGAAVNWTVTSGQSWISLNSPLTGTGNGQVTGYVAPNNSAQSRSGSISLGTDALVVSQEAAPLLPPATFYASYSEADSGIQLTWSYVNIATGYEIERRSNDQSPFSQILSVSGGSTLNAIDTSVSAGERYQYRIRSTAGALNSDWSAIIDGSAPPAIPNDLVATARNANQIELNWTDVYGERSYGIYRAANDETYFAFIARIPADETRYIDAGLDPASTYRYKVEAESDSYGRFSPEAATTTPLETRTINWGTASLTTVNYEGVAYGNGITVAVGNNGLATRSLDYQTWTDVETPTGETLNDVEFASGKFVAVGSKGTILNSPDGQNWTAVSSSISEKLVGVAYFNRWYAIGDEGALLKSDDGASWINATSPGASGFVDIFAGPKVVIIEKTGRFVTSDDGSAWAETRAAIPPDETDLFFWTRTAGAYGGGNYSVVGPASYRSTSTDALSWTEYSGGSFQYFDAVAYGAGLFVAVSRGGRTGYSTTGQVYSNGGDQSAGLTAVTYAADRFVAVGKRGLIVTTQNGFSWTEAQPPRTSAANLALVAHGGGQLVAYGTVYDRNGTGTTVALRNAFDGTGWSENPVVVTGLADPPAMHKLAYLDNQFVLVGEKAAVLTSPDGQTFTTRHAISDFAYNSLQSVAFHQGVYFAGGDIDDGLLRSDDGGVTWVAVTDLPAGFSADRLHFSNRWVGGSGEYYSEDGVNWSPSNLSGFGVTPQVGALGASGSEPLFVEVGNSIGGANASASISWDGRNWNRVSFASMNPPTEYFSAIAYGSGVFVATAGSLGGGTRIWASLDGVRWEPAPEAILPEEFVNSGGLNDLTYVATEASFYGVGFEGLIMRLNLSASDFVNPGPQAPLGIQLNGNTITLTWPSEPTYNYQLRYSETLSPPAWFDVGPAVPGTGSPLSFQTTLSLAIPSRFWSLLINEN